MCGANPIRTTADTPMPYSPTPAMTSSSPQPPATSRPCASLSSTHSTTPRWQPYRTAPNGSTPASTPPHCSVKPAATATTDSSVSTAVTADHDTERAADIGHEPSQGGVLLPKLGLGMHQGPLAEVAVQLHR